MPYPNPNSGALAVRPITRVTVNTFPRNPLSLASYTLLSPAHDCTFCVRTVMTSTQIRTLLQPPDVSESNARALAYLNSTYKSLDDLEQESDLEGLVEQARQRLEELDTKVCHATSSTGTTTSH